MTREYRNWFQDLMNVWPMPATVLKNKVICRQFIHSVAFVNLKCYSCLRMFENRVFRRVFGPKRDKVTGNGENYIMKSLVICTPYPILCGW